MTPPIYRLLLLRLIQQLDHVAAQLAARDGGGQGGLPRVVLAGPPNIGKSSLFNRLVGRDIALVENEAGTTRDWIASELYDAGGIVTCVLVDLAVRAREVRAAPADVARAGLRLREEGVADGGHLLRGRVRCRTVIAQFLLEPRNRRLFGVEERAAQFVAKHDDYAAIMLKAISHQLNRCPPKKKSRVVFCFLPNQVPMTRMITK